MRPFTPDPVEASVDFKRFAVKKPGLGGPRSPAIKIELSPFPTPGPCSRKPAEKCWAREHKEGAAPTQAQLLLWQNVDGQEPPEG